MDTTNPETHWAPTMVACACAPSTWAREAEPPDPNVRKVASGCMWDGPEWEIHTNAECSGDPGDMCRHCLPVQTVTNTRGDGSTWLSHIWVCPRVAVAENEGGCNSTGICIDCILEAL